MDPVWHGSIRNGSEVQMSAVYMHNWMRMCHVVAMSIHSRTDKNVLYEEFCRAMAFGVHLEERDTPANEYIEGFEALLSKFRSLAGQANIYPNRLRSHHEQGDRTGIYESRFSELSAGRKFCITKQRYLAWVPVDTTPTDRICLLVGCAVPFVVRPVGRCYELLGDCYREGMIQAEGLTVDAEPYLFEFQ